MFGASAEQRTVPIAAGGLEPHQSLQLVEVDGDGDGDGDGDDAGSKHAKRQICGDDEKPEPEVPRRVSRLRSLVAAGIGRPIGGCR